MKKNRDVLRPILKMAKGLSEYREKSKLQGDQLIINGIPYGVNDLHKLPPELSEYKAAQKEDENAIVFHGKLSPYSNFHSSPFTIEGQKFPTAEHWIQYSKALFFGDSFMANTILNCETPYKAKMLSHQINGADTQQWRDNGFEKCIIGVRAKCKQNPHLHNMPKTTTPKSLAEASTDRVWGTGISLQDPNALNQDQWHSTGWLSNMLHRIREES